MSTANLRTIFFISLALSTFACKQEEKQPANATAAKAEQVKQDSTPAKEASRPQRQGVAKQNEIGAEPSKTDAERAPDAGDAEPAVAAELVEESPDARVVKASSVAKEIEKDPENADEILKAHELDRESLEALLYEIAKDPQLSAAYRLAMVER